MIELIFVIVILGVLASVAIPRLAATRDDAEVAKAAANLTTAVNDIAAYYTAKGTFNATNSKGSLTSEAIKDFRQITNALDKDGKLNVKGKIVCAQITLPAAKELTNLTTVEFKVNFGADATGQNDPVCKQLRKLPGIMTMCGIDTTATSPSIGTTSSSCKIKVGGSGGIQF